MSDLVATIAEVRRLSEEAQTPVEQFMRTAEVIAKRQSELNAVNRSSPESRQLMNAYLDTLNGNITSDMPTSEICRAAGVPINRGNSQYAAVAKKRLLLTFRKA